MPSPPIADLAAAFRRSLRAAKRAERTQVLYGQSIRFFCDWLTAQGQPTTLDRLTRQNITAWLADLGERVDVETVRTRFRGIRRFSRWLVAEGEMDAAATEGIEMPDRAEKPVRVFTDDEVAAMLKTCTVPRGKAGVYDRRIFDGRRDEVILRLLLDCGVRVSELTNLNLADVDLDQELIYVVGKGNRPRAVPFGAKSGQAIDRYLRIRGVHPASKESRLLLGERGPMSTDGIRWRLETIAAAAGVEGVHPHAFRHTFAHNWLAQGGQERDLMQLAGWRSDAMLSVYARSTAVQRARQAHRRMALGDRL